MIQELEEHSSATFSSVFSKAGSTQPINNIETVEWKNPLSQIKWMKPLNQYKVPFK